MDSTIRGSQERPPDTTTAFDTEPVAPRAAAAMLVRFRDPALVALAALAGAMWIMQIWSLHPTVPVSSSGDALYHLAAVENLREGGWYLHNERLAAPLGQDTRDFPMGGENIHWLALKLLTYVTPTAGATVNLYLALSYPAVAVVAFLVARRMGLDRGPAAVVALLYAFLPFHQFRWTHHLLRVNYFAVPLGLLVVFRMVNWRSLREQRAEGRTGTRWSRRKVVPLMFVALLLGAFDTQHALYGSLILLLASAAVALRDVDMRPLAFALVFGALAATSLAVNNLPALVAHVERGPNPAAVDREPYESDLYGLRPAALVLPNSEHRFGPLATLGHRFEEATSPNAGETRAQTLGFVGAAGMLVALAALGAGALGRRILRGSPIDVTTCGLIVVISLLVGSIGSLATLFATLGITEYRTWGRVSIWIGFASLLVSGAVLQLWARRRPSRTVVAAVLVGVVILGVGDQVSPVSNRVNHRVQAESWNRDNAFFAGLEAALPPGAMVHTLPMARFPEAGQIVGMTDYEHLDGYLHTSALRWSYGGIKGRPEGEWLRTLGTFTTDGQLALIAAAGFDAVMVDRRGYADGGQSVEAALTRLGAIPLVEHRDGFRIAYDLEPLRRSAASVEVAPADVVDGLTVWATYDPRDFWAEEGSDTDQPWRWSSSTSPSVTVHLQHAHRVAFTGLVGHIDPAATEIVIEVGDERAMISIDEGAAPFALTLDLPAGETIIRFASDGSPRTVGGRQLAVLLREPRLVTDTVVDVLCRTSIEEAVCPRDLFKR